MCGGGGADIPNAGTEMTLDRIRRQEGEMWIWGRSGSSYLL
jgi:hypothetical protein